MEKNKKAVKVEKTTLGQVPQEDQKSWWEVAIIQAGIYICVPSLLVGGILASSMSFEKAIISGVLGYIISIGITCITGIIGKDLHVPTCVVTKSSFGESGARILVSSIFAISCIGWFATQCIISGDAFSAFMETLGVSVPPWLGTILWGLIMLITASIGIHLLEVLNKIAVPALVLIMGYGCYVAFSNFGLEKLNTPVEEVMSIPGGIALTASFLGIGMTCASDFTRYQKTRKGVFASSFVGIMPAGVALLVVGAMLTKIVGENDLTIVMGLVGLPLLGTVVLMLSTWTVNTTNAYSAGINLVMLLNLRDEKRAFITAIASIIGVALAISGLLENLSSFLNLLGVLFLPVAGVIVFDYWVEKKGKPENWNFVKGFNFAGILGWLCGAGISLFLPSEYALFIGFAAAGIVYFVLTKVLPKGTTYSLKDSM